jgi:hypothetical protein
VLDIRNLERRWIKYKLKSYAPHIVSAIIVTIMTLLLPFIWFDSKKNKSVSEVTSLISSTPKTTPTAKVLNEESSTVLEPSMDFVHSFQSATPPLQTTAKMPQIIEKPSLEALPSVPKTLNTPESVSSKNTPSLALNRNESKIDIESIEHRFKETSNPSLGLFIARYHYDHGNYGEAYNFSLKTNALNSKMDESWIIFAKSLIKLGKIEQAKKTLQVYISESNSESARLLLESIEKGGFK